MVLTLDILWCIHVHIITTCKLRGLCVAVSKYWFLDYFHFTPLNELQVLSDYLVCTSRVDLLINTENCCTSNIIFPIEWNLLVFHSIVWILILWAISAIKMLLYKESSCIFCIRFNSLHRSSGTHLICIILGTAINEITFLVH